MQVAVKTLLNVRNAGALLAEARSLCRLQHPHVVRVFGFCLEPELAVVMEYVAWGSLQRWINQHRRDVSPEAAATRVSIARGIVSGMAFLHSQGYIHCDLKPANVLLAFDGVRFTAKVCMGLAQGLLVG